MQSNLQFASPVPGGFIKPTLVRSRIVLSRLILWSVFTSALGAPLLSQAQSCSPGETPAAFGFTGVAQNLTVPAGVTSLRVFLNGAQGGNGRSGAGTIGGSPNSMGGVGGMGGRISGTLAVVPGTALVINVGGQGSQSLNAGGLGEGGFGTGGGGTDLRVGGNGVGNRVAIAGGGGGGGNAGWSTANAIAGGAGGVGGGGNGVAGATVPGGRGPFGGGGGAVGTGGVAGAGCGGFPATAGNASTGKGGNASNFSGSFNGAGFGGGGGGGATIGAGGGGAGVGTTTCQQNWNGGGGGGAGGSTAASGLTSVTINNGVNAGNGSALICFASPTFSVGGTVSGQTGAVNLALVGSNPASSQQLTVPAGATAFAFGTRLPAGANWSASVSSAPAGQLCTLSSSSGTNIGANVTSVALSCITVAVSVNPATLSGGTHSLPISPQQLSAASANGGTAPYGFAVTAGTLPNGLSLSPDGVLAGTPNGAGSYTFTVQATSANGFRGFRTYSIVIAQRAQSISNFASAPAAPVFASGGTFTVAAVGGASGNPVVFASSTPAVCTVAGSTATMVGAGACALTANQAGNANYSVAPTASLTVTIGKQNQAISNFAATPAAPVFASGGTFTVAAVGGASGNPVVFASSTPAVCTVAGSTATIVAAGDCALTANQAGNANYNAAPAASLTVTIGKQSQAITAFAATPAAPVFASGGTFTVAAVGGASGNPVVFASSTPAVCTVAGSTATIVGAGSCALTANQAGDANYSVAPTASLTVTIGKQNQAISNFAATPAAPVFASGGTFTVAAVGGASGNPVVFASSTPAVCTVAGSTATTVGAGSCALTANQAGDANYNAAPAVSITVEIGKQSQAITDFAATPASPVFASGGTFALAAVGGASGNPVVFDSSTPAVCTVAGSTATIVAAGDCALTANQAGNANYNAAPAASLTVTIGKQSQVITLQVSPSTIVFTPGGTFTVNATGGASALPVTVTIAEESASVCASGGANGTTITMLSAGDCVVHADQAGNSNYEAATRVTQTVSISKATQTLTFDAQAAQVLGVGGTFSINPLATSASPNSGAPIVYRSLTEAICTLSGTEVTVVGSGTCDVEASQAGDVNYSDAEAVQQSILISAPITSFSGTTQPPGGVGSAPAGLATATISGGGPRCAFDLDSGNTGFIAATAPPPPGRLLNQGLFKFKLVGCDASPVRVTVTWPTAVTAYIKYGKAEPSAGTNSYFAPTGLNVAGQVVAFTVTDGQQGDDDWAVNGEIIDPSGPLVSDGGAPKAIPTLNQWALALLALLCLYAAGYASRRRGGAAGGTR
ncbi:beta strand repeat-containing protein [Ottowia thiooxydans]|uniref:IPTL-CTERM protein sorting domain-containing protein n=1 Tax=Ottowia thiooxydans TaxID=219182 RepID=A0ABV2QHI7_9BURK